MIQRPSSLVARMKESRNWPMGFEGGERGEGVGLLWGGFVGRIGLVGVVADGDGVAGEGEAAGGRGWDYGGGEVESGGFYWFGR